MYKGQTVFLQLTDHLPRRTFRRSVKRYNANHRVRSFTAGSSSWRLPSPSSPTGRACAPALGAYGAMRGNCPAAILLEPAVLYIPSTAMYNAAMYTRVSSLAPRDA